MIYDQDDDALAEYHNNCGNAEFKKGTKESYVKAVELYTLGLRYKMEDLEMKSKLWSNRAQANLNLGNYRKTVEDCERLLQLDVPSNPNVKAFYRMAMAYHKMKKNALAIRWCDKGM